MGTQEIADFTESVNTLIEGKLILIDKHVAQVLKCVAASPTLCAVLSDTVKTMSYPTEFSRARVTWTRSDGMVECSLKLPQDRARLFAFVVCLLTEVDSGRRNILDFVKEYYNAGDNDGSYTRFAEEVLKPFKKAGEALLSDLDPEGLNGQYVEQAERFFKAEKIYIDSAAATRIFAEMDAVRQCVAQSAPSQTALYEYNTASEYLVNAVYLKNPKIISVSFLAYKYVALKYTDTARHVQAIAEILSNVL